MEIHILHKQGKSIREISRFMGVSRNTVRKCLRHESVSPKYSERPTVAIKLDPYKTYIRDRLEAAILRRDYYAASLHGLLETAKSD